MRIPQIIAPPLSRFQEGVVNGSKPPSKTMSLWAERTRLLSLTARRDEPIARGQLFPASGPDVAQARIMKTKAKAPKKKSPCRSVTTNKPKPAAAAFPIVGIGPIEAAVHLAAMAIERAQANEALREALSILQNRITDENLEGVLQHAPAVLKKKLHHPDRRAIPVACGSAAGEKATRVRTET
jgi:hypothetical protein